MKQIIFFIACICILLICYYDKYETVRMRKLENIIAIGDTVAYFKNKLNTQTAYVKTLELKENEFRDVIINKNKEIAALTAKFRRVHHITHYKTIALLDTVKVVFKDSIPHLFKINGTYKKDWYSFNYNCTHKGIEIDSFSMPTQTTIITGLKKQWFLGVPVLTTEITNSNPYIKVTEIKSAELKLTQPWYNKWYIWLMSGIAVGIFALQ